MLAEFPKSVLLKSDTASYLGFPKFWQIRDRWRGNLAGFWGDYKVAIVLFVMGAFADALSTVGFMRHFGPEAELHPGVCLISYMVGPYLGPILAAFFKIFAAIGVSVYLRNYANHILITAGVLSLWACWYNIWGCNLYTPNIVVWLESIPF